MGRVCAGIMAVQIIAAAIPPAAVSAPAPPANDTCAGAMIIPAAGPFPHLTAVISNITSATMAGDPPMPSCSSMISRSIWYKFTPATTAPYIFSVCADTSTTVGDTVMAIYTSSGGCGGTFTEVNCNDDSCGLFGLRSAITQQLSAGVTYYIVIWMFDPDGSPPPAGETAVQLRVTRPLPPLNDTCPGAEIIPSAGPFPLLTGVSDLLLATTDNDPPLPSCQSAVTSSVWYKFAPAVSATYRFSDCAGTATTLRDSVMALYTSAGNCAGPFTELACNDDDCGLLSTLTVPLSAGTTYYIVVWAYANGAMLMDANVQLQVSVVFPPVATTGAATAITSTGAALNGSARPNGSDTWAWFEWGTTTDYGEATPVQNIGSGPGIMALNDTLIGLEANSFVHYRLVATNHDGAAFGADMTFSTTGGVEQRFTLQERLNTGQFRIQFTGVLGEPCSVQTSSNLVDWVNAGAATHLGNGLFEFVDPAASNAPIRFYRTTSP